MLTLLLLATLIRPFRTGWSDTPARWLPSHAIDANALVTMARDARVVALADATHGTHEFFAAKQELVPLFAAAGFRTIAFEAPYAEWERGEFALDDYYFWNNDETMQLIDWARAQNPPVRIAGLDCARPFSAADLLAERVRAFDPSLADDITRRYACLLEYRENPRGYSAKSPADRDVCRTSVLSVRPLLHDDELAHNARVVEQGEESLWTQLANRDAAMAENILWLAQRDTRIIVLGHNEHFGKTPYSLLGGPPIDSAGTIASKQLAYFAVGSIALQGSFVTYDDVHLVDLPFPAPSADDYAVSFREAGLASMFVPLGGVIPSWLAAPHHIRIAGSSGPMLNLFEDLAKKFDAVMYVETSTPAHLR
jgi:erythromycin esterase-like protein